MGPNSLREEFDNSFLRRSAGKLVPRSAPGPGSGHKRDACALQVLTLRVSQSAHPETMPWRIALFVILSPFVALAMYLRKMRASHETTQCSDTDASSCTHRYPKQLAVVSRYSRYRDQKT